MRIRAVTHQRVSVPLREVFRTAIRETNRIDALAVRVVVEHAGNIETRTGYATATPLITGDTVESMEAYLDSIAGPMLVGRVLEGEDPLRVVRDSLVPLASRSPSGTAGLDLALAGFGARDPMVNRGPSRVRCSVTVSAGSVEDMVASAAKRFSQGFSVVKCKLGVDPAADLTRFLAVDQLRRDVAPEAVLWVDANQGWTIDESLAFLDGLGAVELGRLEQPTAAHDIEALAKIRAHTAVPIVADESAKTLSDVDSIAACNAADIVNVKLMKHGGLLATEQVIDRARSHGLGVLVGSMMEHPESVAAAVRLAAMQLEEVHDLDAGWWATDTTPLDYRDGFVHIVDERVSR